MSAILDQIKKEISKDLTVLTVNVDSVGMLKVGNLLSIQFEEIEQGSKSEKVGDVWKYTPKRGFCYHMSLEMSMKSGLSIIWKNDIKPKFYAEINIKMQSLVHKLITSPVF